MFHRLQTLAGTFSDKASLLVDLNERALAMRTGLVHAHNGRGNQHAWPNSTPAAQCGPGSEASTEWLGCLACIEHYLPISAGSTHHAGWPPGSRAGALHTDEDEGEGRRGQDGAQARLSSPASKEYLHEGRHGTCNCLF